MSSPIVKLPAPPDQPKYFVADCEIAPGKRASVKLPCDSLTKYGVVKLKRTNGTLIPLLKTWQGQVKLTHDLPALLGIGIDHSTLRMLCYAGFVKSSRPTPFVTIIDVQSLLDHIEATSGENAAAFWSAENRRKYAEAYWASGMRLARELKVALPVDPDQGELFPVEGMA